MGVRMRRRTWALGLALLGGCGGPVELDLRLRAALEPDPFTDVERVRVVGLVRGQAVALPSVRWDQGPLDLGERIPLGVERLWVEGLDEDGAVVSAGYSPELDFVDHPLDQLELWFGRIGEVSEFGSPGTLEPREGWMAVSLGEAGLLLFGGSVDDRQPTGTWLMSPGGSLDPGPELPEGRSGAAAVALAGRAFVYGGRHEAGADWWLLDSSGVLRRGEAPFPPGDAPVALAAGNRTVTLVRPDTAEVGEVDLADGRSRSVGRLDVAVPGAGFAARGPGRFWVVGGREVPSAVIFDQRSGRLLGVPIPLEPARIGAAVLSEGTGDAWVLGGGAQADLVSLSFDPATSSGRAHPLPARLGFGATRAWNGGGGLVVASSSVGAVATVDLLRGAVHRSERILGPFALGPHPDGSLRGVGDDGRLLGFVPPPGRFVPLIAGVASGVVPDRPGTWLSTGDGLEGRADEFGPTVALVGRQTSLYFVMEVDVVPIGRGQAEIWLDVFDGGSERVRLQRSATVRASPERPRRDCPVADVAALDEGQGRVRVRLSREDRGPTSDPVLVLDVGADGFPDLECAYESAGAGRLGLAVRRGAVRFERLSYREL